MASNLTPISVHIPSPSIPQPPATSVLLAEALFVQSVMQNVITADDPAAGVGICTSRHAQINYELNSNFHFIDIDIERPNKKFLEIKAQLDPQNLNFVDAFIFASCFLGLAKICKMKIREEATLQNNEEADAIRNENLQLKLSLKDYCIRALECLDWISERADKIDVLEIKLLLYQEICDSTKPFVHLTPLDTDVETKNTHYRAKLTQLLNENSSQIQTLLQSIEKLCAVISSPNEEIPPSKIRGDLLQICQLMQWWNTVHCLPQKKACVQKLEEGLQQLQSLDETPDPDIEQAFQDIDSLKSCLKIPLTPQKKKPAAIVPPPTPEQPISPPVLSEPRIVSLPPEEPSGWPINGWILILVVSIVGGLIFTYMPRLRHFSLSKRSIVSIDL